MSKKFKMADEDEIDVLGDFSFNSCFAQNNQGIPSCSSREDTVHPQWLLDSTEPNWYDKETKNNLRVRISSPRRLIGDATVLRNNDDGDPTTWTQAERKMLVGEMAKYGRNIKKISQAITTKTEVEIQTLIDAEYGIHIEPSSYELDKYDNQEDIPGVVGEEVIGNTKAKKLVIPIPKHPFRKKTYSKNSLLKPQILNDKSVITPTEIFYDDDMIIGSTESIGAELDTTDLVSKNVVKYQAKVKAEKKIGNHRRKASRNYDKGKRNSSKDSVKSPQSQGRQRKDSSLSDDSMKSPKMQIVLGSGQALPVSEGEEVIKIEKKKDSEPESDIEIDVDSDNEGSRKNKPKQEEIKSAEEPIAVPLRKFEPLPRRQKKINLDGGGGYTIMHTEAGDLYEVGSEPKRERQPRKQPVHLIRCRVYNADKPAPYEVHLDVSVLIQMDFHAHTSKGEVMGLTGGFSSGNTISVRAYRPAAAAAARTHCDMDPVSQSRSASQLTSLGVSVCGWHHSHPSFPAAPSAQDLVSQRGLQAALEWDLPLLGFITSQHWPAGRTASQYSCLRIEEDESTPSTPVGYQLRVKLSPDITSQTLATCLRDIRELCYFTDVTALERDGSKDQLAVDMVKDVCPQAKISYLDKCISSISHHMRSAGYAENDPVTVQLIQGIRDIFR